MTLYLVQHGKSLPAEDGPDPGLSPEGRGTVHRIAEVAKAYGIRVDAIFHSGKKRAEETADIFVGHLSPAGGSRQQSGLKPMDDVARLAGLLDPNDFLMLVGHLPFMSRLAGWLVTGNADQPVFAFQNGGIVCLDRKPDADRWIIKWSLSPDIG